MEQGYAKIEKGIIKLSKNSYLKHSIMHVNRI